MRVSDYIADFIANQGVKHPFLITGGAVFGLVDGVAHHPKLDYICTENEQGAAMAADAYSRINNNLGVAISTSGPGATNLITGVCCAWYDSIPTLFLTGQVSSGKLRGDSQVRQLGFQETDTVALFSSITKYSSQVRDPKEIRYELEKATHLARSGRPGPVHLDIPNDVQRTEVNPAELRGYSPERRTVDYEGLGRKVAQALDMLDGAERPLIILGAGVRLAKSEKRARALVERLNIPVALTWATKDFLPYDHPLVIEGFGVSSGRYGNFAVQNADMILAIGTRLDTHESSNLALFAKGARKVIVDIDKHELEKFPIGGMEPEVVINNDVVDFLNAVEYLSRNSSPRNLKEWLGKINHWKEKYPICPAECFQQKGTVNPYAFMDVLSRQSKEGDIIITDAGATLTWTMQGFRIKEGQRLITAFNNSPMGYSLPAAIGAYFASGKPIVCTMGDGSMQMNVQELATVRHHNIPAKLFIFDNKGYGMIRQTLDTYMGSRYAAVDNQTKLPAPNLRKVAEAYGIPTSEIRDNSGLEDGIRHVLEYDGPIVCNVNIDQNERIQPKLIPGKSLEELAPRLSDEELAREMIIPREKK